MTTSLLKTKSLYALLLYLLVTSTINLLVNFHFIFPHQIITTLRHYGVNIAGWKMYLGKASSVTWVKIVYFDQAGQEINHWIFPNQDRFEFIPHPFRHMAVYLSQSNNLPDFTNRFLELRCSDFKETQLIALEIQRTSNTCPSAGSIPMNNKWTRKRFIKCL